MQHLLPFLGWSGTVALVFYGLVAGGSALLDKGHRETLSLWLMGVTDATTWTDQFCALFDRIFGARHWSLRCIAMSALASILAVLAIWTLLGPVLGVLDTRTATAMPWVQVMLIGAAVNLIPDYLSLYQTRWVLQSFRRVRGAVGQFLVLLLDLALSAAIIWAGVQIFVRLFGDPISGATGVAGVEMAAIVSPYAVFFYSTFLTSVWAWAYWLSAGVLKLFTKLRLGRHTAVDEHPGQVLGLVGAALVLATCLGVKGATQVVDGRLEVSETLCRWFSDVCDDFARLSEEEEAVVVFLTLACEGGVTEQCLQAARRRFGVDDAETARLWTIACAAGNFPACNDLGYFYVTGRGSLVKDLAQAATLSEKACEAGQTMSCGNLGILYATGRGRPQNFDRATELLAQSCEDGFLPHCGYLGHLYATAQGGQRNLSRAVELYAQACEGGLAERCTQLGILYSAEQDLPQDLDRAHGLFVQGCQGGDALGCNNQGFFYEHGFSGSLARAADLYAQACNGGLAMGCSNLGRLYETGRVVGLDLERAEALFEQACEGGNESGCSSLDRVRAALARVEP